MQMIFLLLGNTGLEPITATKQSFMKLFQKFLLTLMKNLFLDFCLLFIDLKKAFDMVDSKLLIINLLSQGFNNSAIKLLLNYFDDRTLNQTIENLKSLPMFKFEVPQGSLLGPLPFSIFINDLPFMIWIVSKLFADDTTLIIKSSDIYGCRSKLV